MADIETRQDIELVVNEFYSKILKDELIAFFFTDVANLDFEKHLPAMHDFWESIIFGKSKYNGNPMIKHFALNRKEEMKAIHFERWLKLWEETLISHFSGPRTQEAISRATNIANLMQYKMQNQAK